jgi:predicted heme/steroid binding protein
MAELRERKVASVPPPIAAKIEEIDDKKSRKDIDPRPPLDTEPNPWVLATLFIVFSLVFGGFLYYKTDNASNGPFAAWVNHNFPIVESTFNRPAGKPFFGAAASDLPTKTLTEAELRAFDGSDPDTPIYLAINGTIYDVSISPSFYGPGGHYHHFVGRDATRAWLTECWDEPAQLTWRLDGLLEQLYTPSYLDEQLEDVHFGRWDPASSGEHFKFPAETMKQLAKRAMERLGSVTDTEKAKRRAEDPVTAQKNLDAALAKWTGFFANSDKYTVIGKVVYDEENTPAPPPICEAAKKKKPFVGGKMDALMGNLNLDTGLKAAAKHFGKGAEKIVDGVIGKGGEDDEQEEEEEFPKGMPEHVIAGIKRERAAKKAEEKKKQGKKDKKEKKKDKEEPVVEEVVLDAGEEDRITNHEEL